LLKNELCRMKKIKKKQMKILAHGEEDKTEHTI